MRKSTGFAGLVLGTLLLFAGCSGSNPPGTATPSTDGITFSEHVLPLLQHKFAPLLERESGLRLDSWESLIAGSDYGEVVIPFDADNSLLIELATKLDPPHPANTLTPAEIDLVRRWINEGARNDAGTVPYADATQRLYVCNQDAAMVSIIDMETNLVIRTIKLHELGFSENPKPHHTAVEPDGSFWYVSLIGDDKVLKFNRDNELVAQADFEKPGMLALHPTEDLLFVGRSMKAVNPPQRIGIIQRSDMSIDELDVFFARPHALTVDPRGGHIYTASLAENRMATVTLATEKVDLTSLDGDIHTLVQFALSPDGRTMVVGGQLTGQMMFFDTTTPSAPTLSKSIQINAAPWHPVFTPDGRFVYVGNKNANTVTVLDAERQAVAGVISWKGISEPHGSAVSPDGKYVYISNNNLKGAYTPRYPFGDKEKTGTVVVINTEIQTVEKVIELEANPTGLSTRTPR
ncbi:MAG: beta-propeller fold lactonase family protein [Rhodothermales bacterium]